MRVVTSYVQTAVERLEVLMEQQLSTPPSEFDSRVSHQYFCIDILSA